MIGDRYYPEKWIANCGLEWKNKPKEHEECDHLDCAIYSAEEQRKLDKTTSRFVFVICMITILFGLLSAHEQRLGFDVLIILSGPLMILGFLLVGKLIDENPLEELTEYREKGTIKGIRARQIFEDPEVAKA